MTSEATQGCIISGGNDLGERSNQLNQPFDLSKENLTLNSVDRLIDFIFKRRLYLSSIAKLDNTDFVSYIQFHLIIINRKNKCIQISIVIQGIYCGISCIVIG